MPQTTDGQTVQQLLASAQNDPSKSLIEQLTGNPLFTAGFGLAAIAAAVTAGRRTLQSGAGLLYRRMLVDVEVTRSEEIYRWLLQWISTHQQARLELAYGAKQSLE
jgi:mitochondrial chaperone BCS1